jgi:hypothetical protein
MAEQKGNPKAENFVSKVVKDPKQPPDTLLLMGYLGASSEEGYTRLYFDAQLSSYVEIPGAAILHTQEIPAERSALGESYVWIDRNAELIHGKVGVERPKAKFLEGPIFQEFMRGAQFGGTMPPQFGGPQPTPVQTPFCPVPTPSAVHLCPQQTLAPTIFICCQPPTLPPACPRLTHLVPFCPPITLPFCPTEACPPSLLQLCGPVFGRGFGPGAQFGAQQVAPEMQQLAFPFPTSPQVCLHTAPIACHSAFICPTSPAMCLQPSVNIPCLPPQTFTWLTPGSIACVPGAGFGQMGGPGLGAQFGGAAMAQPIPQAGAQQPAQAQAGGAAPQQMQQFAFPFPTSPVICQYTAPIGCPIPTSPVVCLQPSVNIPCLPPQTFPWLTPGSIACLPGGGFGQGGMFGQAG